MMNLNDLKYPIGKFVMPKSLAMHEIKEGIETLASFPEKLKALVKSITAEQENWVYRPDGWSIKQVIHHCADSHMQSVTRFRWVLTESIPTIKTYHEALWAQMSDYQGPIQPSLEIISGLHVRWVYLLNSMKPHDFEKTFVHPDHQREMRLDENLALYAWHGEHHLAHISQALKSKGTYA
jgi:hypothetical protein